MCKRAPLLVLPALLLGLGCGSTTPSPETADSESKPDPSPPPLPWEAQESSWEPPATPVVALVGGTVMTATGRVIDEGTVVMDDGELVAVGDEGEVEVPEGAETVDVSGRYVTPGLIDTHSHMGVYAQPHVRATSDGNEATSPVTAEVWAGDSFWPQDPALPRAIAGGVTTIQVLPGSANLIGGRGVILKMHLGRSVSEMLFPDAPKTLKMACGENPKRVYGDRKSAPSTRMGNVAGYRAAFQGAKEYLRSWEDWQHQHRLWQKKRIRFERAQKQDGDGPATSGDDAESDGPGGGEDASGNGAGEEDDVKDPGPAPAPPARDYAKEALVGVLEGEVLVQMHCYRADEMARMVELGREMGFRIHSFHHAVEAYKIRDVLAEAEVGISTWTDWWGFKLEAYDAIQQNLALLSERGVHAALHSDSSSMVQRLNQEAAKAMAAGRRADVEVSEEQALRWITAEPAWVLGIEERTGTLEPGKMADVVVWSGHPFSVYTRADRVYVDGRLAFDRSEQTQAGLTDFELGHETGESR